MYFILGSIFLTHDQCRIIEAFIQSISKNVPRVSLRPSVKRVLATLQQGERVRSRNNAAVIRSDRGSKGITVNQQIINQPDKVEVETSALEWDRWCRSPDSYF